MVSIPGGMEYGFVHATDKPARQYTLITNPFDAAAFFPELAEYVDLNQEIVTNKTGILSFNRPANPR